MYRLPMVLELDYDKWICGHPDNNPDPNYSTGHGRTMLLNGYGYQCCLGQFASQCGANDSELYSCFYPSEMRNKIPELLKGENKNHWTCLAAIYNDSSNYTITEKVKKIKELLYTIGRTLVLKNFPASILEELGEVEIGQLGESGDIKELPPYQDSKYRELVVI